tara:strand:- start:1657 stop:2211 length:555 start_codon:yes stop_codon:yes gene_type:complete
MGMMQSPLLESIKKTSFFNVFSEEEKGKLVERRAMFKRYEKKGLIIFSEGDKGDSMFVVLSGTIHITKLVKPDKEENKASLEKPKHTVIANMEAGSILGEIALLTGQTRTTYAITGSPLVVVMEINQEAMYSFNLAIQNKFHKQLISTLIGRLNTINKKFVNLKEENLKIKKYCDDLKKEKRTS